jgi:ribosomal protein S18 acetylase RimI-like enzyme
MVTVRPARVTDAEGVARVQARTWQDAYAQIMPADVLARLDRQIEARIERVRQHLSEGRFQTLVAEVHRAVAGFVTYGAYRDNDRPDELDPAVGEVLAIYVDPRRQGRGAGRSLMDAAVGALRAGGATEVRLWVLEENAPSRRFYERYGLAPDGARHTFQVTRNDGTVVDLPEVRYTMALDHDGRLANA